MNSTIDLAAAIERSKARRAKYIYEIRVTLAYDPDRQGVHDQVLAVLYDIDRPVIPKGKQGATQNSWMIFRIKSTDESVTYKVIFRRADHAALFKLACGGESRHLGV